MKKMKLSRYIRLFSNKLTDIALAKKLIEVYYDGLQKAIRQSY